MTGQRRPPIHLGSPAVGSPAWHDLRRAMLNGSEIAPVLGISPYESAFSLWHRKAGSLDDVEQSDEMYWGTQLEDVIRCEFARRHPELFVRDGGGLYRHGDRDWQGGSPDGRIWSATTPPGQRRPPGPEALLECKTARFDDGWGEEGTDEIPVHYRAQCLWYLDVFDLQLCHVAVLISGSDYREYQITRDDDELAAMRDAAEAFLQSVAAGVQPDIDGHDATYQAVRELNPDIDPVSVVVDDQLARDYLAAAAAAKDAATEKSRTAAALCAAMGTARDAYHDGIKIASRQVKHTPGATPYLVAARGAADRYRQETAA